MSPQGVIRFDDAARPGERIVARRWSRKWKDFDFSFQGGSIKGLLLGRRRAYDHNSVQTDVLSQRSDGLH